MFGLEGRNLNTMWFFYTYNKEDSNLLAVVGGILNTVEISVGPAIQVSVLPTYITITSIAWLAFAAKHDVRENAQINTIGLSVTVMASILTWVPWCTDLEEI